VYLDVEVDVRAVEEDLGVSVEDVKLIKRHHNAADLRIVPEQGTRECNRARLE